MISRGLGQNLTSSIVQDLGVAIVTGTYSERNPFPVEAQLCRQYGASRTALREAVKMLTAKGLLGARPRQGTWVQPESRWNLLDPDILGWLLERKFSPALLTEFTEVRLAIEPLAAALAATAAGPAEKQAVRDAIERMRAAERGEDDPLASDIAFHVAVLHASRNRFYAQLTELTSTALALQHPHHQPLQGREARQRGRSQARGGCDRGRPAGGRRRSDAQDDPGSARPDRRA